MQGKGVVKFFLVVMTLVTLAQYLFILPTRKVEKAAEKYADAASAPIQEEAKKKAVWKEKRTAYLDSMSTEEVFKIPFLKSYTYQELKAQQLALGLDLKGGMSVVLQVDLRDFIYALSNDSKDPTFLDALNKASEAQKNAQADYVSLFSSEFRKNTEGKKLASIFARNQALEINSGTSDGEVERKIREKANETVDLTFKLLKERIDKLGVTQPNVSLDASRDLIVVELPGIDNPERARNFLKAAAKLEFWNVYRITDPNVQQAFVSANERLGKLMGSESMQTSTIRFDTIFATDTLGNEDRSRIVRIDTAFNNPFNTNQGPLFDALTPNVNGTFGLAVMGTAKHNQRNGIDTMLAMPEIKRLFPTDMVLRWSKDPVKNFETGEETDDYELYAVKLDRGSSEPPLTGESVTNASANPNPQTNEVEVSLQMNREGTRKWGEMTTKAAQDNNREIAIVLDNEVVSCPRVNDPITNGSSSISGTFTIQEAKDLANILQIGRLPAETKIIQESLVGPSLGQDNINKSIRALVLGFAIVLGFMILYYSGAGIVSIIALLANLFFIFGTLASYGTVLTVPGIAGIVLTIGMAVDANVIIFERVREEMREGKSLIGAVGDGFKNSYSAIVDANVTTILTASVLAYFGLGPIKGFAVVLIIGVLSSLFTAVLVSRLMIEWWLSKNNRKMAFWTGFSKNSLANVNVDWMGIRFRAYIFSGIVILVGLISFFVRGFELGVDFKGGRTYNVTFEQGQTVTADNLRTNLATVFDGKTPIVKVVDTENTFNIVTDYLIDNEEDDADDRVMAKLHEGVSQAVGTSLNFEQFKDPDGTGTHITTFSKVGPTIADDIKSSAFWAALLSLLLIFLYIFIRFSKWQYSAGAVLALFHDVLFTLGIFSMLHGILPFSMEVDQPFIAAILTVIGYSINDTVIVFDRVREFLNLYIKKTKLEVINMAINTTLSRTTITSLTTLFVVLVLFIFGGSSIKGFSFAILVGILVGTYSSIFIATPLMADLSADELSGSKGNNAGKDGNQKRFSKALEKAK